MRRFFFLILCLTASLAAFGQNEYDFVEATDLTIAGKVFQETPNPYERMDFTRFGGWTEKDIHLLQMSSGIIVSFKTDSPVIAIKPEFTYISNCNPSGFAARGFDLYIKKDGKWLWAGCTSYDSNKDVATETQRVRKLVEDMDNSMKECIVYLPTQSKMTSVKIAVQKGSKLEKGDVPFRHRICLHGSSFMHGVSTSRAGQTVSGFLSRATGLQFCNLGVSGDCRMQPQFASALAKADVDAFVFDSFSNGTDKTVEENLFNFIDTLTAAHPGKPLIFMHTIWRERRNFNQKQDHSETIKAAMADSLMKIAVKKYKDVYFIDSNATAPNHDTTVDGIHPSDWGYYLWAESVRKPILKILRKYGIK
ncbi:MAG: SGNH/GDSL hydrolase family protein [Bacteroidales bacterium]|nr:SGNH/GDSL hydrolase family protein [Bacteroidales bacterium]